MWMLNEINPLTYVLNVSFTASAESLKLFNSYFFHTNSNPGYRELRARTVPADPELMQLTV
jgi:hypothetical protein